MASQCITANIALLGKGGVGKTTLGISFAHKEFVEQYDPSNFDTYTKEVVIKNVKYKIVILDTPGQLSQPYMLESTIKEADHCILIFSLTDHESFQHLQEYLETIQRIKGEGFSAITLIGNKQDKINDSPELRRVQKSEAEGMAASYRVNYHEISTKSYDTVENIFHDIVKSIHPEINGTDNTKTKKNRPKCCSIF
ncbi:Ras-related protein Ral-a [Thelohanellus kitauei]|uniref:Ras-related protein Ral-a n=1 Tax=Thelohanellus kitauei TaxID=669202 RepID=A0A0C2IKH8_THEKT|nr:Ras-related protein Ral-a [Thelohanellus kitauei]